MDKPHQNVAGARFRLLPNPAHVPASEYPAAAATVINEAASGRAAAEIRRWAEYGQTPLVGLSDIALSCAVGAVELKDESTRFGLGSFKAIGAAYGSLGALTSALQSGGLESVDDDALRRGALKTAASEVVLACATDGNHGRAVAWAAQRFGCSCEVFVPRIVSAGRRAGIAALGARVTCIDGTYDDALEALDAAAQAAGWVVVSDQAYEGYEDIPCDIMAGYTLIAAEAMEQWPHADPPTHVFVQAGVGGFAAAVCGHLWQTMGEGAPMFVCVEPNAADCLFQSALAGTMVRLPGNLDTVMGCLSCGEPSSPAWRVLETGAAAFLAIDDAWAVDAMKALATPQSMRPPLAIGESGAAGVAALCAVSGDSGARRKLGLDADSRILVFATEGATDPETYAALVGRSPAEVVVPGGTVDG